MRRPDLLLRLAALLTLFAMIFFLWTLWSPVKAKFHQVRAVSAEQIRRLGGAIERFGAERARRPAQLEELVEAGMLDAKGMFDERRGETPTIDAATGRFADNPDVIYFPALRKDDPGELVLLCTLLLRDKGDPFHVIYNDGRYAALGARELVVALNRTYRYLGGCLAGPQAATAPTTED